MSTCRISGPPSDEGDDWSCLDSDADISSAPAGRRGIVASPLSIRVDHFVRPPRGAMVATRSFASSAPMASSSRSDHATLLAHRPTRVRGAFARLRALLVHGFFGECAAHRKKGLPLSHSGMMFVALEYLTFSCASVSGAQDTNLPSLFQSTLSVINFLEDLVYNFFWLRTASLQFSKFNGCSYHFAKIWR